MRLATDNGKYIPINAVLASMVETDLKDMTTPDKEKLRSWLQSQHRERERVRWGKY